MTAEVFRVDQIILSIIVVLALLFGAAPIPQLARSSGSTRKEFERKGTEEGDKATLIPSIPPTTGPRVVDWSTPQPVCPRSRAGGG